MKLLRSSAIVIVLAAALAGCTHTGSAQFAGTWGAKASGQPSLTLTADGRVSGTDGCNNLVGTWKEADGDVEFGPLATTLMACPGVDTWLAGASSASVDDSTMTIYSASGTTLGTLDKH